MSPAPKQLRKEVFYPHPVEDVWTALTDPYALAEWLMPNNFRPVKGHKFRFMVDPMPGFYSGIQECEVLDIDPPRRMVWSWVVVPRKPHMAYPQPMILTWSLTPENNGTRLVLVQEGLEHISWWNRFSMNIGWNRMLKSLFPKVLANTSNARFTRGAITKRDYGTKTVPDDFAK